MYLVFILKIKICIQLMRLDGQQSARQIYLKHFIYMFDFFLAENCQYN